MNYHTKNTFQSAAAIVAATLLTQIAAANPPVIPSTSMSREGSKTLPRDVLAHNEQGRIAPSADQGVATSIPGAAQRVDRDLNNIVNSSDLSLFLNDWFHDLSDGQFRSDFDANSLVNSADVTEYMNAWFESLTR